MADIKAMNAAAAYNNAANMTGSIPGLTSNTQNIGPDFGELVAKSLNDVADTSAKAEAGSTRSLIGGGKTTLDEVALSLTNAELSVKTLLGIRDRVISAYQDIIKMPI
jgi:flagellar hook-basal body complex protein FliE